MPDEEYPYTIISAEGTVKGRLTEEDVIEVAPEYINLEPNYEQTAAFLGEAICQGAHEQPYLAMWSLLDPMRYLVQSDLPAALRVVEHFKVKHESWEGPEDGHLEADYEDRNGYPDLDGMGNFDYSPELDG